ncbi:ArdC-like ssDNA-binding domain-containing protein [Hymenobacter puniceus]|uniref:ArdC-like ssDNA-binding domain-containing protein n=1 Tax=Hymenobacter sp. BT190 TaxID=2763505 RepID=UPI001650EE23|nr:ArdC-like ssDNA-binding domain-containing protein [Hymenobacter sp. BT190]MBC6698078.1 hypothetical protein [Hymenobacter sp. BT190]
MVKKAPTPEQKEIARQRREDLKQLSNAVKPLVEMGEFPTVNAAIIETYRRDGHETFNTFWQWKTLGKAVKKGAKAFVVWAQPVQRAANAAEDAQDEYEFFPICYLFSNLQVE